MVKLLFSLLLILSGLVCGYIWQLTIKKNKHNHEEIVPSLRKLLQKIGLLFFMPVSFTLAVWVVSFANIKVALLPLVALSALFLGGLLGLVSAKLMRKDGKTTGTLYCCGSFTNIGSIGALVAFVFLGEAGFGLVALYKMFEEISYYTVGFPVARYYSGGSTQNTFGKRILEISKDPFVRAAITAFIAGLLLNVTGIERPQVFERINSFLVPMGTFILLLSIGLGMRFSSVTKYYREGFIVAAIKFILVPLFAVSLAYIFGFQFIDNGLPLKVVLVASSMPVAFTALVAASIYDLDLDLANSCWLITTGLLIIVLPLLYYLLGIL